MGRKEVLYSGKGQLCFKVRRKTSEKGWNM